MNNEQIALDLPARTDAVRFKHLFLGGSFLLLTLEQLYRASFHSSRVHWTGYLAPIAYAIVGLVMLVQWRHSLRLLKSLGIVFLLLGVLTYAFSSVYRQQSFYPLLQGLCYFLLSFKTLAKPVAITCYLLLTLFLVIMLQRTLTIQ